MSNLNPIREDMMFVEDVESLRGHILDYVVRAESEPTEEQNEYIENIIYKTAQLPFPRIVMVGVTRACRADGCRNDDLEDEIEILHSFDVDDLNNLIEQLTQRG